HALDTIELAPQSLVGLRIVARTLKIADASEQLPGDCGVNLACRKLAQALFQPITEGIGCQLGASHANDRETLRQQIAGGEVVETGTQQAAGEVSGRTKDHQAAGIRRTYRGHGSFRRHDDSALGSM